MAKIRIYELAKELGTENKDLVNEVRSLGIEIKGVMSTLTNDEADRVRRRQQGAGGSASSAAPPAAPTSSSTVTTRPGSGRSKPASGSASSDASSARPIRRRAKGPRPAVKEREKEQEREREVEEAQRVAAPVVAQPIVRPRLTEVRRAEPSPAAAPSQPSSQAVQAESAEERRSPPAPEPGDDSLDDSDEAKIPPKVGDRIELPKGTRRFRTGLAAKIEQQEKDEEIRKAEVVEDERREAVEAKRLAVAQEKAAAAAEAAKPPPSDDDDRRVVRNADGVIVAAASKRSEPKILGFISLPSSPRRQQVIITEANKGKTEGRATARKRREERSQQRGRRPRSRVRRDRGGPKQVSTIEMSDAKKRIRVDEAIQISDMAHQMGVKASKLIRTLWGMGMRNVTINNAVDVETAELVAAEFGYTIENVSFQEDEFIGDYEDEDESPLRAPVVTIMGHVDHGKTTLLDYIRKAKVAEGEAGGITQHIGAYRVETAQGPVVFIDTPGHQAFSAMRSRGAAVTDIVALIVAADDGVMPTTKEAIDHAKDADVPVVVVINKIDKPDANAGRVEQMLMKEGLVGENYGGETTIAHISAKTGQGVEELLETLAVQAEILELRAPIDGPAAGTVIESRVDKGRGTVATVLVQAGELCKGDIVVANEFSGKVRGLYTPAGKRVKNALPSTPVEVLGLDGAPPAGERFYVVESEKDARQIVSHRREQRRRKESVLSGPSLLERIKSKKVPVLKIVVKADVQGSAEALKETLEALSVDKVRVDVIHAGVGGINETDVKLAAAAGNPLIIGFNVKTVGKASQLADHEKIPIETFSVIYEASDRIREMMIDLLEPEYREVAQGEAEVRALFPIPRLGVVAGCRVIKGNVTRSSHVRVRRQGRVIYEGRIGSLRVFKDDVKEVKEGQECGIVVDGFAEVEPDDILEAFELETIRPEL
ncbi:Translation initiation factor 2 [Enhygromyxa salina]|uniref:Translation initiation factor IF-2 n=1 Tax=Enhygromyxa salina TaxID=215803 RepID=A0A0C2D4Q7_9BACT|nr:translation initiation factor IF-2 [Enhygromyxa salina]KIG18166.1 Translation initiation factor 2 [Enhygromyxa salina]